MVKSPFAANMLSYMRSLQVSEAVMSGVTGTGNAVPIEVLEKGVRGQSSHAAAKVGEFKPGGSNPQMVDYAMLPDGCERLEIRFSLLVMAHALCPSATDTPDARTALEGLAAKYAKAGGFKELALRYVGNIANGRFAWRNRYLSDEVTVEMKWGNESVAFNPLKFGLHEIANREQLASGVVQPSDGLKIVDHLVDKFARGLSEKEKAMALEVRWLSKLPQHSEVFPSQEYARDDNKRNVSRVYASIPRSYEGRQIRWAIMHSQKIGAALRCIDNWHRAAAFGPVPVNPYAGVQEAGVALRIGGDGAPDFYALKRQPQKMQEALASGELTDDAHFFVANLVRGGVFGDTEKA